MARSIFLFAAAFAIASVSALHASCEVSLTVKDTDVKVLNKTLIDEVKKRTGFNKTCVYAADEAEFCGYKVVSLSEAENHFQHETPKAHYVDDIKFTGFEQKNKNVVVNVQSKSEPTSLYDYDTNFCNIFNLFRDGKKKKMNFELEIEYKSCMFHPDTSGGVDGAYDQCNKY